MDYEMTEVTLKMTPKQFEVVFEILQETVKLYEEAIAGNAKEPNHSEMEDVVYEIKTLNFEFKQ